MAATYEPIASTTLGSAAADIVLSSIPVTHTDLVLILNGGFGTNSSNLRLRFNSDTGTNYSNTMLLGDGSATASIRGSNVAYVKGSHNIVTSPSTWIVQIMSYANTNVYKTSLGRFASSGGGVEAAVNLWRSTSAISSITISTTSGNLSSGFTASLYGIKAA